MPADDGERRLLQLGVVGVEQRDDLFAHQVAVLHPVQGDERPPANTRIAVAERGQGALGVVDADQGVDQRMFQEAIAARAQAAQQDRHSLAVADTAERLRRLEAQRRLLLAEQGAERRRGSFVALKAERMDGGLSHTRSRVGQGRPQGGPRLARS